MKPPLKPFTVEVKRSRSSPSVAKPISSEPPVFIEARPASAPVAPSQARQLAEQLFTSLTASSSAAPETRVTAERVFRAAAPRAIMVEEPTTQTTTNDPAAAASSAEETVPAKPRKPRVGKVRTSLAPTNKVVKPKMPDAVKAAALSVPAHPRQNLRSIIPEASSPALKIDQAGHVSPAPEAVSQERRNGGWGPGERWKRRLRHLR
jgi:hypothetical protein